MRSSWIGLSGFALALLVLAPPSFAQYMYLDSNGDGVHTAADELHAVGPTVVDIWLDTGHNRDGTVTVCKLVPATPLSMFSYVVNLKAAGGTVSYSAFTNRISQFGAVGGSLSDDTQFSSGGYSSAPGVSLPPGKYLLGTVVLNVTSGTPSLDVVTSVGPFGNLTSFGSYCDGDQYPNTIVYGSDWFDADGLPFGTGGGPNQGPAMVPPSDMTVLGGENAIQSVTATDPEGQPLSFAKISGPGFMFVHTTDQGTGTAHAEIRLSPFASDQGTSTGSISVSDGAASDQASFGVTVAQGPNHLPYLPAIPKITVVAGRVERRLLSAGDPDGGTVHLRKAAGPAFVTVRELAAGPGGVTAALTASPTLCDVGSATAVIAATDGSSEEHRQVQLNVVASSALPDSLPITSAALFPFALALGDLNEDGRLDVVVTRELQPAVSVLLGLGDGHLGPAVDYPLTSTASVVSVADFDSDGHLDVAAGNLGGPGVSILLGRGDGTLGAANTYGIGVGISGISSVDMNHDGVIDLVTSNRQSGTVSVLLGNGDGTFTRKSDTAVGTEALSLVTGDFTRDGRPDVAVSIPGTASPDASITILPGLGDGTFGDALRTPMPIGAYPFSMSGADWNWDGAADLAVIDLTGNVQTFSGRGNGTFDPPNTLLKLDLPYTSAAADLNADGNTDLVVGDPGRGVLAVFLGDGAGGFSQPAFRTGAEPQSIAIGDMNSDGRPDIVTSDAAYATVYLNRYPAPAADEARAFVADGSRTVPVGSGGANLCLRVEPVGGSYQNGDVDLASIALRSEGTGTVSEIYSVGPRKVTASDTDQNGIAEIGACFSQPDLGALFDHLRGRNVVTAEIAGSLMSGRMFCTSVELTIQRSAHPAKVAFSPNPLNPRSTLTVTTTREGPAKALIFDIQGRLTRTLVDTPLLTSGEHDFLFDGRSDRGSQLSSGVYFYRVESMDGSFGGRVVILK